MITSWVVTGVKFIEFSIWNVSVSVWKINGLSETILDFLQAWQDNFKNTEYLNIAWITIRVTEYSANCQMLRISEFIMINEFTVSRFDSFYNKFFFNFYICELLSFIFVIYVRTKPVVVGPESRSHCHCDWANGTPMYTPSRKY